MLEWLVSVQFPDGGFQAGVFGAAPLVPAVFNTGQILLGLASGVREWGDLYRAPMRRAATWLAADQDPDGCWRKFASPFAMPGEKTYNTHAARALLEAARLEPMRRTRMPRSPTFDGRCGISTRMVGSTPVACNPAAPLTHTLGCVFRGIAGAYRFTGDDDLLTSCRRTADGLLSALRGDGFYQHASMHNGGAPSAGRA